MRVCHEASATQRWLHLHGIWADTPARAGDAVNVIFRPGHGWQQGGDGALHAVLSSGAEGLLVLHPDVLMSGTSITAGLKCPRQALLQVLRCGTGCSCKATCVTSDARTCTTAADDSSLLVRGAMAGVASSSSGSKPTTVPRSALAVGAGEGRGQPWQARNPWHAHA